MSPSPSSTASASSAASSKIAVIGVGIVGRALATRFAGAGHVVTFGVRDCHPRKDELARFAARIGAHLTGIGPAIDSAEVVLLAMDAVGIAASVPRFGSRMAGTIIIDATDDIGGARLDSAALIAAHAPGARVYRAFNSLDWQHIADARSGDAVGDLRYRGPEDAARHKVEALIAATGLRPVWSGETR